MPRESFPAGVRTLLMQHEAPFANAATVGPDLSANTDVTIASQIVGQKAEICGFRFRVGPENFAGGGGTLTFTLRKGTSTGTVLATVTIPLASALRGATIEGTLAGVEAAKVVDTDTLVIQRTATGTAFTTGRGTFEVVGWVRPQARR